VRAGQLGDMAAGIACRMTRVREIGLTVGGLRREETRRSRRLARGIATAIASSLYGHNALTSSQRESVL